MKKSSYLVLILIIGIFAAVGLIYWSHNKAQVEVTSISQTQVAKDMANREVKITTRPKAVVGMHAIPDTMLWRLAPQLQKSTQQNFVGKLGFLPKEEWARLKALPNVNAFYKPTSTETIMAIHPDFIVTLTKDQDMSKREKELNAPVLALDKDTINQISQSWRLMGKWLGQETMGNTIANYYDGQVATITKSISALNKPKPRIWMANGLAGETPATSTIMTDSARVAGGEVYWDSHPLPAHASDTEESLPMPIEELIAFNPEYIFCTNEGIRKSVVSDKRLSSIDAIKNNRVYTQRKYMRVDSVHSIIGARWMANIMYPGVFGDETIGTAAKKYYNIVWGVDLPSDSPLFEEAN